MAKETYLTVVMRNSVHNTSTEAATNDTSVTDADLTSEEARAASTGATNGASKSKSVLPANIMSPSTPSKGLSRGLSSSSSKKLGASATPTRASSSHANAAADDLPSSSTPKGSRASTSAAATPKARSGKNAAPLNGPAHLARDSLLGLSAVSEATTAVSTSDGSPHTASGGLFGSESVDFEELLSREQLRKEASDDGQDADAPSAAHPVEQAGQLARNDDADGPSETATAAGRLRQVLSIIEEDANGPLSRAARVGTASRPVSSVYDAGPDPFADHVADARRSSSHTTKASKDGDEEDAEMNKDEAADEADAKRLETSSPTDDGASRHRRTPSKLSID